MTNEPVVLAIETSSRLGSVALGFGDKIAAEKSFSGVMKHSSEVFPTIQELLEEYNLTPEKIEHLYISNGPGSFTGLRIAVSLAKIMHLAHSIKIAAVDSLDVVAYNAIEAIKEQGSNDLSDYKSDGAIKKVAAIVDAKRRQFFISEYNVIWSGSDVSLDKLTDDYIMSAEDFCKKESGQGDKLWLLGDGLVYYKKEFSNDNIDILDEKYWSPKASCVYKLGREMARNNQFQNPLELKPNYLYRPEIKVKIR